MEKRSGFRKCVGVWLLVAFWFLVISPPGEAKYNGPRDKSNPVEGHYEKEAEPAAATVRKMPPLVIVGVGIVVLAVVIVFLTTRPCDIRGWWIIDTEKMRASSSIGFRGEKESGSIYFISSPSQSIGSYSVNRGEINFNEWNDRYQGRFSGCDEMGGTYYSNWDKATFTWTARRERD